MATAPVSSLFTPSQLDQIDRWGTQIAIQIEHGNVRAAHRLVDDCFAELDADTYLNRIRGLPLTDAGLDLRTVNMLERQFNATSIGDLLMINKAELLAAPNVGSVTLLDILSKVLEFVLRRQEQLERETVKLRGMLVNEPGGQLARRRDADEHTGPIHRERLKQVRERNGGA